MVSGVVPGSGNQKASNRESNRSHSCWDFVQRQRRPFRKAGKSETRKCSAISFAVRVSPTPMENPSVRGQGFPHPDGQPFGAEGSAKPDDLRSQEGR